jgi:flagellar protein FliJ
MTRRFRLTALERLRTARRDDATFALAAARHGAAQTVAARDAIAAQLAVAVPPVRTTPQDAILAGSHREALRARLAEAGRAVADAEHQVDRAVAAWRAARAELRVVHSLHERHRAALAAADARRDQLVLDDLAARIVPGERVPGGAP